MNIIELDTCASTNDEAWRHLGDLQTPRPTLVTAVRQTKGRGRQGRVWEAGPPGNLIASLAIPAPTPHLRTFLHWLPLAAGVSAIGAIVDACAAAGGANIGGLRLKWPNDVMWDNAKMGGILCESRITGESAAAVVIGFGLNIVSAPDLDDAEPGRAIKTAALAEHIPALAGANRVLARSWAENLLVWADRLAAAKTESLREEWRALAKLDRYGAMKIHDRDGGLVALTALDLDISGKLLARREDTGVSVLLDQADSL